MASPTAVAQGLVVRALDLLDERDPAHELAAILLTGALQVLGEPALVDQELRP